MAVLILWALVHLPTHTGLASYYNPRLAGRPTASGEPFDPSQLTAASNTHFKTHVEVTNLRNGRSVVVWVNDRGPNRRLNRILDLSPAAYWAIADETDIRKGTMPVEVREVEKR